MLTNFIVGVRAHTHRHTHTQLTHTHTQHTQHTHRHTDTQTHTSNLLFPLHALLYPQSHQADHGSGPGIQYITCKLQYH